DHTPWNYIKRVIGLPGQTILLYQGDVYTAERWPPLESSPTDEPLRKQVHSGTLAREQVMRALEQGQFKILRKGPNQILAMRRLVYDNDHPAADLVGTLPPRWSAEEPGGWQ